ncbi:MAG TPA: Uma2 family endonuclease [Gemmata sp.]
MRPDRTGAGGDRTPTPDSMIQSEWRMKLVGELRELFADQQVFVASDLFWYPLADDLATCQAPDVLVAFDRPPGFRESYRQWEEDGTAPHVVFELRSPNDTRAAMAAKQAFYDLHGVEEYYLLDPHNGSGIGWVRNSARFELVYPLDGYVSPRLGVRVEEGGGELRLFTPDGREFRTREQRVGEIQEELRQTTLAFESERERALNALRWLSEERGRAEQARSARDALAAKLRELGIDPDEFLRAAA